MRLVYFYFKVADLIYLNYDRGGEKGKTGGGRGEKGREGVEKKGGGEKKKRKEKWEVKKTKAVINIILLLGEVSSKNWLVSNLVSLIRVESMLFAWLVITDTDIKHV